MEPRNEDRAKTLNRLNMAVNRAREPEEKFLRSYIHSHYQSSGAVLTLEEARSMQKVDKNQRRQIWDGEYGEELLFGVCPVCEERATNLWYSTLMYVFGNYKFICSACRNNYSNLPFFKILPGSKWDERRIATWVRTNQLVRRQTCYCCQTAMLDAYSSSWHSGHIVAKSQGGADDIENLVPICTDCNLGMQNMNLEAYRRKFANDRQVYPLQNFGSLLKVLQA